MADTEILCHYKPMNINIPLMTVQRNILQVIAIISPLDLTGLDFFFYHPVGLFAYYDKATILLLLRAFAHPLFEQKMAYWKPTSSQQYMMHNAILIVWLLNKPTNIRSA
jgi:hypothetical protein